MITKHHLQKLQEEEEKRIADAFTRAKKIIKDKGLSDDYMVGRMEGKKIGGKPNAPFRVMDNEAIWIMMENNIPTDNILEVVYETRGKMSKSAYLKNKEDNAEK